MNLVNMDRTYGVEIEFFGVKPDVVVEALENAGINASYRGYTHTTTSYWKIVTDSSVTNKGTGTYAGLELVSPVLKGEEGLKQLQICCRVLDELGAKVDKSCGLHVHLDARDLTLQHWKNTVVFYHNYQRSIDKMLPKSRRSGQNQYCQPFMERDLKDISALKTLSQLRDYAEYTSRYKVINVTSFLRHGTIEFREHSGTIDFEKIYNWLQFCMVVIEKAKSVKSLYVWRNEDDSKEFEALMTQIRKAGADLENIKYYRSRKEALAECI